MFLDHLIWLMLTAMVAVILAVGAVVAFLYCSFNPSQDNDDESDD